MEGGGMKVYLEKGHSMRASLRIYLYKLQHFSTTDPAVPEAIRRESHTIRIEGDGDETIEINGTLEELKALAKLMAEALGADE